MKVLIRENMEVALLSLFDVEVKMDVVSGNELEESASGCLSTSIPRSWALRSRRPSKVSSVSPSPNRSTSKP